MKFLERSKDIVHIEYHYYLDYQEHLGKDIGRHAGIIMRITALNLVLTWLPREKKNKLESTLAGSTLDKLTVSTVDR